MYLCFNNFANYYIINTIVISFAFYFIYFLFEKYSIFQQSILKDYQIYIFVNYLILLHYELQVHNNFVVIIEKFSVF
jgi:hypothetical protein